MLKCNKCDVTNCRLWAKRIGSDYDDSFSFSKEKVFCFLCANDLHINDFLKRKIIPRDVTYPDVISTIEYSYLPAIIADDEACFKRYHFMTKLELYDWRSLPTFPAWWKFENIVNFNRAADLQKFLEQEIKNIGLSTTTDLYWSTIDQSYLISFHSTYYSSPYFLGVEEAIHVLFWLQNLKKTISEKVLWNIINKIRIKYKQ